MAKSGEDYDDLFKSLIIEFFPDYLRFFHPDLLESLKVEEAEWITPELRYSDFDPISDPAKKPRRFADIVAKIPYLDPTDPPFEGTKHLVLDIEPEKGSAADLRPRMPAYWLGLRMAHPEAHVVVAALYIDVGLDGIGLDRHVIGDLGSILAAAERGTTGSSESAPKTMNSAAFCWPYVGLPGLDAESYLPLAEHNPLIPGLVGFMRISPERRLEMLGESILAIDGYELPLPRKNLLVRGLMAGLDLDDNENRRFQALIRQRQDLRRAGPVIKTWYDQGIEKGIEKGIERGMRKTVLHQVALRFGASEKIQDAVAKMNEDQLQDLAGALIDPSITLDDLGLVGKSADGAAPR